MKRVNLETAAPSVRKFIQSLRVDSEGVELAIADHVVCKVVPPLQYSEAEKAVMLDKGWELIRRAYARNRDVPARVIAAEVRKAVNTVRGKR
jgi:hypothetical protein